MFYKIIRALCFLFLLLFTYLWIDSILFIAERVPVVLSKIGGKFFDLFTFGLEFFPRFIRDYIAFLRNLSISEFLHFFFLGVFVHYLRELYQELRKKDEEVRLTILTFLVFLLLMVLFL